MEVNNISVILVGLLAEQIRKAGADGIHFLFSWGELGQKNFFLILRYWKLWFFYIISKYLYTAVKTVEPIKIIFYMNRPVQFIEAM